MTVAVVLDSAPLGIITHPRNPPYAIHCRRWVSDLQAAGRRVILPEIIDFELRRELLRRKARNALRKLDWFVASLEYLPLTTPMFRLAAGLWAHARQAGRPTAPDPALDVDVIVAAQALSLNVSVIVATSNPAHLSRFVPADLWENITP